MASTYISVPQSGGNPNALVNTSQIAAIREIGGGNHSALDLTTGQTILTSLWPSADWGHGDGVMEAILIAEAPPTP